MNPIRFAAALAALSVCLATPVAAADIPEFRVDPFWPKPLPNQWIFGQIGGIATDRHDHVWVYQRPRTLSDDERGAAVDPPTSKCCKPAPPVLEFDAQGNLVQAWGGEGAGFAWPRSEHGIFVDANDHVWIAGNDKENDAQVLEFTREGKFVKQIGEARHTEGSNSTRYLGRPALAIVDEAAHELYVADGYGNKRIVVFDARTGEYRRHWGAYGSAPDDADPGKYDPGAPLAKQFRNPVHCVRISRDGLVYVCDRVNDRFQVFRKDGRFVAEYVLDPNTRFVGSVWDIGFSTDPQQKYLFVADGTNNQIHILLRENGNEVGAFGRQGRNAGEFHWLHTMAIDSRGNIFTGDVDTGKRVQRFERVK
jgi:6-phosphogluconolactonase (cycloisomerase 2 family)